MVDIAAALARWQIAVAGVREQVYRAETPRERERWHAVWLAARGLPTNEVAALLERDAHTVGGWLTDFADEGPAALAFEQTGAPPPRPRPCAADRSEGGRSAESAGVGAGVGDLVLE
ncbi:MAG: helix-turn-helix domain-containing protein, partial [Caldilineaceae bacterium]